MDENRQTGICFAFSMDMDGGAAQREGGHFWDEASTSDFLRCDPIRDPPVAFGDWVGGVMQ